MYQLPNKQPDTNQSFYSDQTSQFSQQPPPPPLYQQPGQYPQYPQYPPQYPMQPALQKKWYKHTGGVILLLVLFFPVGLFLMWRYAAWTKKTKWIVTGVIAVLALIGSINNGQSSSQNASIASPTAPPVAIHQVASAQLTATAIAVQPIPTPKPTVAPTAKPTATPIPKPTVAPTAVPQPTQPPAATAPPVAACSGVIDEGTCYSTDAANGTIASSVPGDFCNHVTCVSDFKTKQNGYVVLCNNGVYSHSGGVRGACSRDGGEGPPLYRH